MTTQAENTPENAPDDLRAGSVWIERTGTRRYRGYSQHGGVVEIGSADAPGVFTPGELLKIALAACTGMTTDSAVARRLGDGYSVRVLAHGVSDEAEDRYKRVDEEIVGLDLSSLDEEGRSRLLTVMKRVLDEHCTVARSVKQSAVVVTRLDGEEL